MTVKQRYRQNRHHDRTRQVGINGYELRLVPLVVARWQPLASVRKPAVRIPRREGPPFPVVERIKGVEFLVDPIGEDKPPLDLGHQPGREKRAGMRRDKERVGQSDIVPDRGTRDIIRDNPPERIPVEGEVVKEVVYTVLSENSR